MQRAINQRSLAHLPFEAFLDAAAAMNCVGVEPRNDLGRPLFDGLPPEKAADLARQRGLKILALGEIYPFNRWTNERATEVQRLLEAAEGSQANAIILIPDVEQPGTDDERKNNIRFALDALQPMLEKSGVNALIEPIGFQASSIRTQLDIVPLIEAQQANGRFKIIHDTFQHFIASDDVYSVQHIATVQISGYAPQGQIVTEAQDGQRDLVDEDDRCQNVEQLRTLMELGFDGPVSFETTDPEILHRPTLLDDMRRSFEYIEMSLHTVAV